MAFVVDSCVTINHVNAELQNYFSVNSTIESFTCIIIGKEQGALSVVYKIAEIVWFPPHKTLPSSVVVKIPSMSTLETVLSKDDTAENRAILKQAKDTDVIRKFVDVLADIQAWSIKHKNEWIDYPDMQIMNPGMNMYDEQILDDNLEKFKLALKNDKDFAAYFDADLIDRVDELKCEYRFLKSQIASIKSEYFADLDLPTVLVHCDCHPFNMMFAKILMIWPEINQLRAIIDWQGVHPGFPTYYILRLVCGSVDATMRCEYLPRVFDRWYNRFVSNLDGNNALKCTKHDLWILTEIMFYYKMCVAVPFSPWHYNMKDGATKGMIASVHTPRKMAKANQALRDALETKKRLGLK